MKAQNRTRPVLTLSVALLAIHCLATTPRPDGKPADMTKPGKVFILLGQSNRVGLGKIKGAEGSLDHAVKEKKKYTYLVDDAGAWLERKDVRFVRMMSGQGPLNHEWMGIKGGTIGPEYGLGHVVGNAVDAPVMILKACNQGSPLPGGYAIFSADSEDVGLVGEYKPLDTGFNYRKLGVVPKPVAA